MSVIDEYVRAFFAEVSNLEWTGKEISELFRYSMCKVLNLDTPVAGAKIEAESANVIKVLNPICVRHGFRKSSIEKRQGVLEAGVHCLEMSRKRAGV